MVVFVLSLAACHGSSTSSATTSSRAATTTVTTANTPKPTTATASTTTASTTTPAAAPKPTVTPTGIARCRSANLTAVLSDFDGAAGTSFAQIVFRNDAGSPCEMTGYPGVSFLNAAGAEIGVPAQRTGASYHQVSVAAGANVYAELIVPDPDVRACPTGTAQLLRVYPPNETRPLLIRLQALRVCVAQIPPASIAPVLARPQE